MQMQFNQKFINPIAQIFNFNQKKPNQKELSKLIKLVNTYKLNQEGQKCLFVILFASKFSINKDNLKELAREIFKKNTPDQMILNKNELDELFIDLVDMKLNGDNIYFNMNSLENNVNVSLEELYINFNGKIDDNINVIVKSLQNNWDVLTIGDFDKLRNKVKTTLLWQLKFGISTETMNFMKKQNKDINVYKCKLNSIEELYNNQINTTLLLQKEIDDFKQGNNDNISSPLQLKLTSLLQENQNVSERYNELKNKYDELQKDYYQITLNNKPNNNIYNIWDDFEVIEDKDIE